MDEPLAYRAAAYNVKQLDETLIASMAELYFAHYDGSSNTLFRHDLEEKDEVVLLFHAARLAGFSTFKVYGTRWRGQEVRVVYSGDTVVDRQHWGQQALAFTLIGRMGQIRRETPDTPFYWFLLVKGHRTFKYLSTFCKSFFPHWQTARPDLQALAEELARARFGEYYDPVAGIVHFPTSRGHLRPDIAEPRPEELSKPATRFFL
ncbi:MAG: hypothetical protein LBU45_07295, partial [Azoarcus sp.]|nr:hypothetical protein [Azoarcus sp.]